MKYKASLRGNVLGIISLPSERAMYAETRFAHASFSDAVVAATSQPRRRQQWQREEMEGVWIFGNRAGSLLPC